MSDWSSLSHHLRLQRKSVPDHFHKALGEIQAQLQVADQDRYVDLAQEKRLAYKDDLEADEDCRSCNYKLSLLKFLISSKRSELEKTNKDCNNNCSNCKCFCTDHARQRRAIIPSSADNPCAVSPRKHILVDCTKPKLQANTFEKAILKLSKLLHDLLDMGANCSTNLYDGRNWHNVGAANSGTAGKRGRLLKKCSQEEEKSLDSRQVPSHICICQGQAEKKDSSENVDPVSGKGSEILFVNDNHLSSNVESSGHVKVSRVAGHKSTRTTSTCDVSPHRLLTRRHHSPNGQASSLEDYYATSTYNSMRQRSHSWSNGRIGTRSSYKTLSPTNKSILSPVGNHKVISTFMLSNSSKPLGGKSSPTLPQCPAKAEAVIVHEPTCPMYNKLDGMSQMFDTKIQALTLEDIEDDLAPITRQRAASESQTIISGRFMPRRPNSSDQSQNNEHAHVHWADEEKGCSLSTSVFVTSIRPRSYSHGAMGSVPHRPILKKVTGF